MPKWVFTLVIFLGSSTAIAAPNKMTMGDGTVKGEQLQPYELTWIQCAQVEGRWTNVAPLTESLVIIGALARHTQTSVRPDGMSSISVTYFDRSSLAPLRMEQRVIDTSGATKVRVTRRLSGDGYEGEAKQGEARKSLSGQVTSQMWHGGALGLPLATINPDEYPVTFASSMIGFDGTYDTIATLAGREEIKVGEATATALMVDVEWHHNESGDVYAAGPRGSGGRFWLVPDPPPGMPYVPQYQTDTYLVTMMINQCPVGSP